MKIVLRNWKIDKVMERAVIESKVCDAIGKLGYALKGDILETKLIDDLGMDSLDVLELLTDLEKEFDIKNSEFGDAFDTLVTIEDVVVQVEKYLWV